MSYTLIALSVLLFIFLVQIIRIASEHERFAVFRLGRYEGLKGPGLMLKFPGKECQWVRLKVGDKGELASPELGNFKEFQVPVEIDSNVKAGSVIRIIGFNDLSVKTMMDPEQRKTIVCEKCGHVNQL